MIFSSGDTGGNGADTGDIPNSLRFRPLSSCNLSRTMAVQSEYKKAYVGAWLKFSANGTYQAIFTSTAGSNDRFLFGIQTTGEIYCYQFSGSATAKHSRISTALFRDPNTPYHVEVYIDSTLATAADRIKILVNGVRLTSFTTLIEPALNDISFVVDPAWGARVGADTLSGYYFNGNISRFCLVDAYCPPVGSFGYLNSETNQWVSKPAAQVKATVELGGVNSCMLDFDNGTSLTTLGYDKSSKGNNWTLNNFSLTAGPTYDWSLDTPSNNFATLNPLNIHATYKASNGNLTYIGPNGGWLCAPASIAITQPAYAEFITTSGSIFMLVGIADIATQYRGINAFPGDANGGYGYYGSSGGQKYFGGSPTAVGVTATTNDIIGVAFNPITGNMWVSKNGVWIGGGDPTLGTSPMHTGIPTSKLFTFAIAMQDSTGHINMGQRPFSYPKPAGFNTLCTQNMTALIANPKRHFDVKFHLGNGATQNVTGLLFKPDLSWIKSRSHVVSNGLFDSVRGAGKGIFTNLTQAETDYGTASSGELYAFTNDGFSLGPNGNFNASGITYVDWNWKAGGAAVANTAGTIASQVSANVEAGFSIVNYGGTGVAGTVGHGLPKVPQLVIIKARNSAQYWRAQHASLASGNYLYVNTGAAVATQSGWLTPTANTLDLGGSSVLEFNNLTYNYLAYCFTEIEGYSKIGSFLGNGSVDGTFVYCGFLPAFVLIKSSSQTADWWIWDTARNTINPMGAVLYPNLSNAEYSNASTFLMDAVSNGFKYRNAQATVNASGATFTFYAVAGQTLKYANGR